MPWRWGMPLENDIILGGALSLSCQIKMTVCKVGDRPWDPALATQHSAFLQHEVFVGAG